MVVSCSDVTQEANFNQGEKIQGGDVMNDDMHVIQEEKSDDVIREENNKDDVIKEEKSDDDVDMEKRNSGDVVKEFKNDDVSEIITAIHKDGDVIKETSEKSEGAAADVIVGDESGGFFATFIRAFFIYVKNYKLIN